MGGALAWHPHPDVWLLIAVLGGGYVWAIRRLGPTRVHPIERVVTRRQIAAYSAGLTLLWAVSDWPVHELAEGHLYSVHMLQHVIQAYVAPPLLLLGTPAWLLRWLLEPPALLRAARTLTRPAVAIVTFNVVIAVIHVPWVVERMATSEPFHFGMHALLVGTALCMWSPVMAKLIELPALSYPGRMFYLFLQSLVPTVPASYLTFGENVLYRGYDHAVPFWGLSPITDQRMAGLLMKLGGGFILWGVIAWYFFRWFGVEDREGIDVLEWQQVDRDLGKVELTKR